MIEQKKKSNYTFFVDFVAGTGTFYICIYFIILKYIRKKNLRQVPVVASARLMTLLYKIYNHSYRKGDDVANVKCYFRHVKL